MTLNRRTAIKAIGAAAVMPSVLAGGASVAAADSRSPGPSTIPAGTPLYIWLDTKNRVGHAYLADIGPVPCEQRADGTVWAKNECIWK